MKPTPFSLFLIIFLAFHLLPSTATNLLKTGQSLAINQTITSPNQTFSLGFFSPPNSSKWFAAIWYTNHPKITPVWTANRDAPLTDPAGTLTVSVNGNLAVLNSKNVRLWSTDASVKNPSTTAVFLLDSGNLLLQDTQSSSLLWQSFDHPTDTLLPGMKLYLNKTTGESTTLSSGSYSLSLEKKWGLQLYIFNGGEVLWRGPMWLGIPLLSLQLGDIASLYIQTVYATEEEIFYTYKMQESSLLVRYVLEERGAYSFKVWNSSAMVWSTSQVVPTQPCDFFNRCGAGGSCDSTVATGDCKCIDGYEPREKQEWKNGNFTGGCVYSRPLLCDGTDGYKKIGGVKVPDKYSVVWDIDRKQCEGFCSRNCSCRGFSHVNYSSFNQSGARCLVWMEDLVDLVQIPLFSQDFYVRLSNAELTNGNLSMESTTSKNRGIIKIVVPVAITVGLLSIGVLCCFAMMRFCSHGKEGNHHLLEDMILSNELATERGPLPMVDFRSVRSATGNFSSSNLLGEGGFGPVYKGKLKGGEEVAVKRLSKASNQGCEEFANEVLLIANLQHRNLVRVLGWCAQGEERILIYELMPNKSLDLIIFDETRSTELTWEKRFAIIRGVADGLLYLHQYSRMRVIHRDLKTNNILLDRNMSPKISDFGLARIFEMNQTQATTRKVVGTYGYMAPEYALDGTFSEKSDVFSFGVIVLETVTGKRSTGFYPYKNSLNLLGYVRDFPEKTWQMWAEGRGLELLDPLMDSPFSASEVLKCIQVGLLCVQEFAADRPAMDFVVSLLSGESSSLPDPKQPAFAIGRQEESTLPPTFQLQTGQG